MSGTSLATAGYVCPLTVDKSVTINIEVKSLVGTITAIQELAGTITETETLNGVIECELP